MGGESGADGMVAGAVGPARAASCATKLAKTAL